MPSAIQAEIQANAITSGLLQNFKKERSFRCHKYHDIYYYIYLLTYLSILFRNNVAAAFLMPSWMPRLPRVEVTAAVTRRMHAR